MELQQNSFQFKKNILDTAHCEDFLDFFFFFLVKNKATELKLHRSTQVAPQFKGPFSAVATHSL